MGVLLQDQELIDFAGPNQELTLYNHHYHDGVNGEGAQNYMAMLNSYYYPYLRNPEGWLELYPDFLKDHPFFGPASTELNRLATVRGLFLEFADQHEYAWRPPLVDPEKVRANEALPSRNWPGFGVGLLRVGGPGHRQEVSLHYSRATLHTSSDALGISCWVDGIPVMRLAATPRIGATPRSMRDGPRSRRSTAWATLGRSWRPGVASMAGPGSGRTAPWRKTPSPWMRRPPVVAGAMIAASAR